MSYVRRLALPGLIILVVYCLVDVAYVRAGEPQSALMTIVWSILWLSVPLTFFAVLRSGSTAVSLGKAVASLLAASLVWLLTGGIAVEYFHIAIGGSK